MRGRKTRASAVTLLLLSLAGCATWSERTRGVRASLAAGRPEDALSVVDEELGVRSPAETPADLGGDRPLLLLERATLLQGLGDHAGAARDFGLADGNLDRLDLAQSTADDLARYLLSEEASRYRAPAHERLLLNLLSSVSYLASGDLEGARVEARRYRVMEDYYRDHDPDAVGDRLAGFGSYLCGAVFEASGDLREASRGYAGAWRRGFRGEDLAGRLVDLFRVVGAPSGEGAEAVADLAAEASRRGGLDAEEYRRLRVRDQALVVVLAGIAPWRRPERVPIGLALTVAASVHGDLSLSASQRERADRLAAEGLVKWISFPVLSREGAPGGRDVAVRVAGQAVRPDVVLDVDREVEDAWQRARGPLMVAAISRMLARAAVGFGVKEAIGSGGRGAGAGRDTAKAVGWLAGLAAEGLLTAADRPETRSWTTLPARILLVRAGRAEGGDEPLAVEVPASVGRESREIQVAAEGMATACFSRYR